MEVVLFPGYNCHQKLYESYFPKLQLISPENITKYDQHITILTHSIGIVDAILWVREHSISNYNIIAMDPPVMCKVSRFFRDDVLKLKYEKFFEIENDVDYSKIQVFRSDDKRGLLDKFKNVIYYDDITHYPYQVKKIRDEILCKLSKHSLPFNSATECSHSDV